MVTKNRRIAAYLPPDIDEAFKAFKISGGFATQEHPTDGDSQALIAVLQEFLKVERKVAYSVSFPDDLVTLDQLQKVESKLDTRIGELSGELLSKLRKFLERLEALEALESRQSSQKATKGNLQSDLPKSLSQLEILSQSSESPAVQLELKPLSGPALSERFGKNRKAVADAKRRYAEHPEKFSAWTMDCDPDRIPWLYDEKTKKYHPLIASMS